MSDEAKTLWMCLRAQPWRSLTSGSVPVQVNLDEDSPCGFIPIFDTREKAEAWGGEAKAFQVDRWPAP